MNTRLIKKKVYEKSDLTGLCKRCDWFINGNQLIKNKDNPQTIFITGMTGNRGIKYFVDKLLPKLNNIILIIASEDYTFPLGKGDLRRNMYEDCQNHIQILLDSESILHIFVENLDIKHNKITPIPLGLLPNQKTILNLSEFLNINYRDKKNLCLVRHRTRNGLDQWKDRKTADDLCENEWSDFITFIKKEIPYEDFINELKLSKFCLCIHGGGYDPCPRFFESIIYGAIPIIQHSPLDDVFKKYPIIFIDELKESSLSKDFLEKKYEELKIYYEGEKRKEIYELLTLDYWWNIITFRLCKNFSK